MHDLAGRKSGESLELGQARRHEQHGPLMLAEANQRDEEGFEHLAHVFGLTIYAQVPSSARGR